jgi:Inositol polyphosphate kinase
MEIAGIWTNSSSRGFRVIDYTGSEGSRNEIARSEPKDCFYKFFNESEERMLNARTTVDNILHVLDGFENFVFIASSLLFCYASGSREVRVKMIDFGHSYIKGNDELIKIGQMNAGKYRSQFTGGLAFLSRSLKDGAELARISKLLSQRKKDQDRLKRHQQGYHAAHN